MQLNRPDIGVSTMMNRNIRVSVAVLLAVAGTAAAQGIKTVRIASGLSFPVFVTAPPGDASRLFIVEQRGSGGVPDQAQIKILNLANNSINAVPFLTIPGVATGGEQGLLGLAFAPDYATTGRFFVNYTRGDWATVIARYTVSPDPNVANPTGTPILTIAQPFDNHNGGWIGFGPLDGFLYAAMGDGGSGGDPLGNGQDLGSLLGKILRIDVSGATYSIPATNPFFGSPSSREEVWAFGLRNPWRPSFDRVTGNFYIADVGQEEIEEVNVQEAAAAAPVNYGWRCFEGNSTFSSTIGPSNQPCPSSSQVKFPIHTYTHAQGCSITGGYVYRGCRMPWLRGTYFFADYCSAKIWSLRYAGGGAQEFTDRTSELATPGFNINGISSFGEDGRGELYICDQGGGEVYRIIPRCQANCDGTSQAPILNANDFLCFIGEFASGNCYANCDGSTVAPVLTANDFQCYLNAFVVGCS